MVKKVVFATKNKGKLKEINEIMKDIQIEVISMEEAGINIDVEEDGNTFEENAMKKAREIMKVSGSIVLADDSGLEVDFLDGAPGIYSARFGGENATDSDKNEKILGMLGDAPKEKRTARFVCVIAAAFPNGSTIITRGTIEGEIGQEPKGENGFGYDPILFIPEYNRTIAEMTMEEKNKISHRGKALEEMKRLLGGQLEESQR